MKAYDRHFHLLWSGGVRSSRVYSIKFYVKEPHLDQLCLVTWFQFSLFSRS